MKPFWEEMRREEKKGDGREEEKRGNRRIEKGTRGWEEMGKEAGEREEKWRKRKEKRKSRGRHKFYEFLDL